MMPVNRVYIDPSDYSGVSEDDDDAISGVVASTTQTIAGGTPVMHAITRVTTVANDGDAVTLPLATDGDRRIIMNKGGGNSLKVFPAVSSHRINALSLGAAYDLPSEGVAEFICAEYGSWDTFLTEGVGVWWDANAVLDADFANGRFRWNGVNYSDETALLAAIGGTKTGIRRVIGPYTLPGAPELLANTDFNDLTGWTSVLNGTSAVAIFSATAQFTSDGATGTGQGGAGITADVTTEANTPYALEVQTPSFNGTSSMRFGSTLYGNEGGSFGLLSPNTLWRLPVSGRGVISKLYLYRAAAGVANVDRVSVKKATIFAGFEQGGFTAEISAKAPPTHATTKMLATFHSGGLTDRVAVYRNTSGTLIVQVRYANGDVANLTLGTLADDEVFKVRFGAKTNQFYAQLNDNGVIFTDLTGTMPPLGRLSLCQEADATLIWDGDLYRCTVINGGGLGQFIEGIDRLIHFEGDSFAGGAYGVVLPSSLATVMGRAVYNTGAGGATMDQISARLIAAPDEVRAKTSVIWDGDQNGISTVAAYCDLLATAITALGHNRFVVIPPCVNFGQADLSQETAIRDEFLVRWPNNTLDWRDFLTLSGGVPIAAMYYDKDTDTTHLSQAAMDLMAPAISAKIVAVGG